MTMATHRRFLKSRQLLRRWRMWLSHWVQHHGGRWPKRGHWHEKYWQGGRRIAP